MTEEQKQAATRAVVAIDALLHNIRRDAPQLSGKAMGYAENAAAELRRALTQRPAAQTDELPGMWDHADLSGGETDAKPEWRDLFWALARELKCLPSTDPGANQHVFRAARALASLPTQPAAQATPEPVGEAGTMPGTSGFTMACFHADKVPVGTKLYTRPAPGVPEGYALVGIEALEAWGKLEEVKAACVYPFAAPAKK